MRIDVNASTDGVAYAIPPTNPFLNQNSRRAEIWTYGLRNPWRYALDATSNRLYMADVGEYTLEEINVVDAARAGINYGWNITEGTACFDTEPCDTQGIQFPILEYAHDSDDCAVVGGYVYRGNSIPELQGRYFYSDVCGAWLKSFLIANDRPTEQKDWNVRISGRVNSLGQDAAKELYLLAANGTVYRIVQQ